MDKSFEGLLVSIFLHILLVWLIFSAKAPSVLPQRDTTEITIMDTDEKSKAFVTETDQQQKEDLFEKLKEQSDLLSQFTKRVKKQMKAANNGPTQNAVPQPQINLRPTQQTPSKKTGTDNSDRPPTPEEEGIGRPSIGGGSTVMRQVAIGQSSIAEHIPGIEEGAFTALNTDQFTYYAFFARMNEQVRTRWIHNVRQYIARLNTRDLEILAKSERHTMVEIVLTPDGQFHSSSIIKTSGDNELDSTTYEAFRLAAPFPNPPKGMIEADGLIHLKYGFMVQFRPPSAGPSLN